MENGRLATPAAIIVRARIAPCRRVSRMTEKRNVTLPIRFYPRLVDVGRWMLQKVQHFPRSSPKERGMLQFVQQFGVDRLQIEGNRPKWYIFCNIDLHMRFILPFLLYKIQHWLTRLQSRSPHIPGSKKRRILPMTAKSASSAFPLLLFLVLAHDRVNENIQLLLQV